MSTPLYFINGDLAAANLGKIVCVGRNYAEHAKELGNPVPKDPILFIKPASAYAQFESQLVLPESGCHYEMELAVLIGKTLSKAVNSQVMAALSGLALALDLTKRELQGQLKQKGLPWELAKAFDGACPLSRFVPMQEITDLETLQFRFSIDGQLRQSGHTRDMLNPIVPLIAHMSQHFTLEPGDVVLTGTPKGVGPLPAEAHLQAELVGHYGFDTTTV